jgi:hypothetical protein
MQALVSLQVFKHLKLGVYSEVDSDLGINFPDPAIKSGSDRTQIPNTDSNVPVPHLVTCFHANWKWRE